MNKPDNITENDWVLLQKKYKNLDKIINKINHNYPVQYLIGDVDFYGYKILVNKKVLIPRFETENLVEKTINLLKEYNLTDTDVLDIGTGSGCISIALKKELPDLSITALDKSSASLRVARKNSKINKTNITFIHKNVKHYKPINKYGLVISNPPYIGKDCIIDPKTSFEPKDAIIAQNNGYAVYEIILKNIRSYIKEKSVIAFEIGETQGPTLLKMATQIFPNAKIILDKDLALKNRYLFIINE